MAPDGIGHRVEGLHAVAAAIAAGRVTRLVVERSRLDAADVAAVAGDAESAGAAIEVVDDVTGLAETSAPQGVVAEAEAIPSVPLSQLVGSVPAPAALVALDHLEDPRNVGAIARSALAFGFGALIVPSRRAAPLSASAFKAAAGALEHVGVCVVSSMADAVVRLSDAGVWSVGLAGAGATAISDVAVATEPLVLVVGAEGGGMSRLVSARVDVVASIPIDDRVESLNASVAAAVAMYAVSRKRLGGTLDGAPPG